MDYIGLIWNCIFIRVLRYVICYRIVYMIILRYLGGLFVWLSILLYFVALCILAAYTWDQHLYYANDTL